MKEINKKCVQCANKENFRKCVVCKNFYENEPTYFDDKFEEIVGVLKILRKKN
jgi:hypothetical protein